ncbi:MAG: hypothetical protein R3320_11525 [Nitriliruptorales bacterium]|nr:hypothetical protein [Nitriliruptorales bacterium]
MDDSLNETSFRPQFSANGAPLPGVTQGSRWHLAVVITAAVLLLVGLIVAVSGNAYRANAQSELDTATADVTSEQAALEGAQQDRAQREAELVRVQERLEESRAAARPVAERARVAIPIGDDLIETGRRLVGIVEQLEPTFRDGDIHRLESLEAAERAEIRGWNDDYDRLRTVLGG